MWYFIRSVTDLLLYNNIIVGSFTTPICEPRKKLLVAT